MSAPTGPDGTETVNINLRSPQTLLDRIDDEWQGSGVNSWSEYIRYVLHDAVEHPTFDRDELLAIALGKRDIRMGETYAREDIVKAFDLGDRD